MAGLMKKNTNVNRMPCDAAVMSDIAMASLKASDGCGLKMLL
jgi:hypothetical protein